MECKFCLANISEESETCSECGKSFVNKDSEKPKNYLEAGFKKINEKVDRLLNMNDEMKGILFFKKHKYSETDLLNSSEYNRIRSLIYKIHDDIEMWKKQGKLSIGLRSIYNTNRDLLDKRMDYLENQIRFREKTFWEKVEALFIKIVKLIKDFLPYIWNGLMILADKGKSSKGFIGVFCNGLLSMGKIINKLLTSKQNRYVT